MTSVCRKHEKNANNTSMNMISTVFAGCLHDPGDGVRIRVLGVLLLLRPHARGGPLPCGRGPHTRLLGLHVEVGTV